MADERDLVSIIIPVYNSKERLGECLDSVVSQDGPPLEVIVVDDCSTDGSLELLRAYEERYPFVHVYTKENEGVSAARNYGLSRAAGNWIQFADSDDKLYPGAVKQLWERIRRDGSDVVIGGYWNEKENREVLYKDGLWGDKDSFMEEFPGLFTSFFIHVPWNKMYRREILEGVRFPEDLDKGEDLMFNLQVLERAEKISSLRQVLYFYHNVSGQSLSFRFREDAMEIEERLYREVERFWKKLNQGAPPLFLQQFFLDAAKNKYYTLMGRTGYSGRQCRRQIKNWVCMEVFSDLYQNRRSFCKKDRILLFLMEHRWVMILYLYYKWQMWNG